MSISSIQETNSSIIEYFKQLQSSQQKKSDGTNEKETTYDTFSMSNEAARRSKMPPPPEAMDFENMSDEDFNSFLAQSLEAFGGLPGVDGVSSVDELTEEQLSELRKVFTEMSQNRPVGPGSNYFGGPQPLSQLLEDTDEDELMSILEKLLEKNGSIPGLTDEETTSVYELTQEQLNKAKQALIEETKQQEEEMMQRRMLYNSVISAYEKNLAYAEVYDMV